MALSSLIFTLFISATKDEKIKLPVFSKSPSNESKKTTSSVGYSKNDPKYVEGEIIIKYKDDISLKSINGKTKTDKNKIRESKSLKKIKSIENMNIELVEINDGSSVEKKIKELEEDNGVEYAEPNYVYHLTYTPNDTSYNVQWALENTGQTIKEVTGTSDADMDVSEMWDIETDHSGDIVVAVIDSGVALNHPDISSNLITGYDTLTDGVDLPYDGNGHGTHVSGVIAALVNNNLGISGISKENNVKVMPIRAGDSDGRLQLIDVIEAINYATAHKVDILNLSFGAPYYSQIEYDALAAFPGLIVAAAGNEGVDNDSFPSYPASFNLPNIISVAATDQNDGLADFSNYGATSVDVGAPGVNIYSLEGYRAFSEDFEGVMPPDLGLKFTTSGTEINWGTAQQYFGTVIWTDLLKPYTPNADSYLTSTSANIDSTSESYLQFFYFCDLPSVTGPSTDYLGIEIYNGVGWTEVEKFNQSDQGEATYDITTYKNPNFSIRFHWHTDASDNDYLGCLIDDIKIVDSSSSQGSYQYMDGTSMATPYAAAVAAVVWGRNPSLSVSQLKQKIMNTGDSLSSLSGKTVSGKRINANNAYLSVISPVLSEVSPIGTTTDTTPSYTFSSTEEGTISYGGPCTSSTTTATAGSNTITFAELNYGTYSNCTITVTDSDSNTSAPLLVSEFIIQEAPDTIPPELSEVIAIPTPTADTTPTYLFTTNESGTISYGGSCSGSDETANRGLNYVTFNTLSVGTYSNCTITVTDISENTSEPLSVTTFDIVAPEDDDKGPALYEIEEIGSTNDPTPTYTFYSSDEGSIIYEGSCSSNTESAIEGFNEITLNELEPETYSDCTITVEETQGNRSTLNISSFTILESGENPPEEDDEDISKPKVFHPDKRCHWKKPEHPTWIKLEPKTENGISGMYLTWTQYDADKVNIKIDDGTGNYPWKISNTSNDGHEFLPNVSSWQNIMIKPINHCKEGEYSIAINYLSHPRGWYGQTSPQQTTTSNSVLGYSSSANNGKVLASTTESDQQEETPMVPDTGSDDILFIFLSSLMVSFAVYSTSTGKFRSLALKDFEKKSLKTEKK